MKFSIEDFLSKCDQIRSFLGIWLHLLKKSLMENFIFCTVTLNSISQILKCLQTPTIRMQSKKPTMFWEPYIWKILVFSEFYGYFWLHSWEN